MLGDVVMKDFFINSTIDNKKLHCVDFNENLLNPNIVLQICHGMAEHIKRYENFAKFLEKQGIKVYGMDNRGHGGTVDDELYGHISDEKGAEKLVEDVYELNKYIKSVFPNKKIVILGHSMGSMIVRNFINKYHNEVDGAIICGTASPYRMLHRISLGISKIYILFGMGKRKSNFVNKLAFKNYNSRIEDKKTEFDWLSRDNTEVDRYILDKDCGFLCTNMFFHDLITLIKNMSNKDDILKIKKDFPIFFISGNADPVGDYGKGVMDSYKLYSDAGIKTAKIKLYDDMRHEILNEIDKEVVYVDILEFLKDIELSK